MGYFISVLLFFPLLSPSIPKDGWVQWQFEFPNQITCEVFLDEERESIKKLLNRQLKRIPHTIKDVQCMTIDQVIDANTQLGHTPQWKTIPKKKLNQPMI
jgi:hypothetical protein